MNQEKPKEPFKESRIDPRVALVVQAVVEIDKLAPRSYGVCEISRGGMFLAYQDSAETFEELKTQSVKDGAFCEIAFSVHLPGHREDLTLAANIVRITEHGIGVKFQPHDPPPLGSIAQLFARVEKHL